jgi:hypothetical protein
VSTPTRGQLLARYRQIGADSEHVRAELAPAPVITPVHRQVVALLDELLGFVPADAGPFGGLTRMLKRLEPALLRDFAKVPPEQVVAFLHELGHRMLAVGEVPTDATDAGASAPADQSASA